MKKMYVINLDRSRIIILSGLVLAIFGFIFLLGSRFSGSLAGPSDSFLNPNPEPGQNSAFIPPENEDHQLEALIAGNPPREAADELPVEDERLFEENRIPIADDPFLSSSPSAREDAVVPVQRRMVPAEPQHTPQKRQVSKPAPASTPVASKPVSPVSKEKFYTIQLGAYVHEKDAIAFRKQLIQDGLKDARVDRGIRFYYVRVGRFRDKDAVESLYKKIHDTMKLEAIVVLR